MSTLIGQADRLPSAEACGPGALATQPQGNPAPFLELLLEDDPEREAALAALLVRLAGPDVRVIRVGIPARPHATLQRAVSAVAGPGGEIQRETEARLIVDALAERQGVEKRVVLLIEQAELLGLRLLRSLQAMAPWFVRDGLPTLQVIFIGRPEFRLLLESEDLLALRTAMAPLDELHLEPVTVARRPVGRTVWRRRAAGAELPHRNLRIEPTLGGGESPPVVEAEPARAPRPARRRWAVPLVATAAFCLAAGAAATWNYGWMFHPGQREEPAMPSVADVAVLPDPEPLPAAITPPDPGAVIPPALPDVSAVEVTTPVLPPGVDGGTRRTTVGQAAPAQPGPTQPFGGPSEDRRGGTSNSASRGPATATSPKRVVIHVPAGSIGAEALAAYLMRSLDSRPAASETRQVPETPSRPSIRYFYPVDASAAREAAAWLAGARVPWDVQDFSSINPRPSRGTIEVWLPRRLY